MNTTSSLCDTFLLQQSLSDQLSEQQEEQLATHLTECESCRKTLQEMAGDQGSWRQVGSVLRNEFSNDETQDRSEYQPGDFIVDYLHPSTTKDSIGRLGTIEIRQFIGQGAHGIVLKGFQEELNRLVAVKVMAPQLASIVAARQRFAREAKAAAAIVHPNVMPILHVDSSGQLPFLVMPYVDCESLQERLDRDGSLPIPDVLRIGLQVARGLAAAHAQGLVHRDVKPANILLERGVERVMLTDFGLARAVDDATLTRSGLIAGTPHYMSPEQARGDAVDTRSDLFSLGSVLYAMSTGRPPFRAESTYGILRRVTDDSPRPLRERNPEIPDWFEAIVLKLLSKSAADRFESADDVARLLEECLAHAQQPDAIPLPLVVRMLTALLPPRARSRRWNWLAVPIGLVSIGLAVILVPGLQPGNALPGSSASHHSSGALNPASSDQAKQSFGDVRSQTGVWERDVGWNDGLDQEMQQLNTEIDTLSEATSVNQL